MPEINDLTELDIKFVSLTRQGVDPDAHVRLAKAVKPDAPEARTVEDQMPKLPDALRKALGDEAADDLSDEQVTSLTSAFEDASTPAEDDDESKDEPVATDAPEAVATADAPTDDVNKSVVALQKSLDETRDSLAAEVLGREEREFVAANTARFSNVGDKAEAVAKSLFAVRKGHATDEDYDRVDAALAGASEQIAKGVVVGSELGSGLDESAAGTEFTTLHKAVQDGDADLDGPAATAKVLETPEGRAAYDRYDQERAARAARLSTAVSE